MTEAPLPLVVVLGLALACAFAAIVFGKNLTRSIAAALLSLGALGLALLLAGTGLLGLILMILSTLTLGLIQLFGWMLVDVDRDHLPPTDRPTSVARSMAFLLLGGGLVLLLLAAHDGGEFTVALQSATSQPSVDPNQIGSLALGLFGSLADLATLLGFAIASCLLATLLLLQDDEGKN